MSEVTGVQVGSIDWGKLAQAVEDTGTVDGLQGISYDADTQKISISLRNGDKVDTVSLSMPELDTPGVVDSEALESLCAKIAENKVELNLTDEEVKTLESKLDEVFQAAAKTVGSNSKSVFFDLYALMALLAQVAQAAAPAG